MAVAFARSRDTRSVMVLEKVLLVAGIAAILFWAGAAGLRCLAFVRRFLPRRAFLERGNEAILEVKNSLQKALSGHREVAKAVGFIAIMFCLNALAPLIFFTLAYGRVLSAEELAVFLALGNISSLFSWLTPSFFYLSWQGVSELWRWKHDKAGSNSF
jgi:hypothetical protein